MRQDIEIHVNTKDIALVNKVPFQFRDFVWVDSTSELKEFACGEIRVPYTVTPSSVYDKGVYFNPPYAPLYKHVKLRIARVHNDGSVQYIINAQNGSEWFSVKAKLWGQDGADLYASQLMCISDKGLFGTVGDGVITLYSCNQSDFNIVDANRQNSNSLLACVPGNLYRYPLTGVGLVRWINASNVELSSLTSVIESEFASDGAIIKRASYNYSTNQMSIDVDVTNTNK